MKNYYLNAIFVCFGLYLLIVLCMIADELFHRVWKRTITLEDLGYSLFCTAYLLFLVYLTNEAIVYDKW